MNGDTPTPDLRLHNQHLHGWGVVNGLQLRFCRKDEGGPVDVALEAGYAIDPTGADIRLPKRTVVQLGNLAEAAGLARRNATGALEDVQVSVLLQRDGSVAVEKYEADSTWDRLQGTMLRDLVDEHLAPLIAFVREDVLARPGRVAAFLNLLAPLWNPRWGAALLPAEGPDHDDAILRASFDKLRDLLAKKTFTGMYEGLRFPTYDVLKSLAPVDVPRPETISGHALDDKLRVGPGGNLLYAFGSGNVIRVYDHDRRKLVQELAFPAADAVVQDLAFSRNGTTVYVTALLGKDKAASLFAVASVDGVGRHAFRPGAVTVCSVPFVTLETSAHVDGRVFAVARGPAASGGGLYVIDPTNPNPAPTAAVPFNAVGPFTVADRESGGAFGYACASSGTAATSSYDRVVRIDLLSPGSGTSVYKLPAPGDDDLCVVRDDRAGLHALFVVVNGPQGSKQLLKLDDDDAAAEPAAATDLGARTAIRLAYGPLTRRVFVTSEDQGQGRVLDPSTGALSADVHPLQLGPVAVRAAKKGERWVALNFFSRTLTTIPAQWTSADGAPQVEESVIDRTRLIAYRQAALHAFLGLAGRLAQYLKDCAMERFLVESPQDVGQQLYLGAVSFKDGKVWQICGLDRRRYVHSFPSVEYWLSLVPVLPVLSLALEEVGAWLVPALFDRLLTRGADSQALLESSAARAAYQTATGLGLRALVSAQLGRWAGARQVASAWYGAQVERAKVGPTANTVSTDALVGTTVADAEAKAEAAGLLVVSARRLDPVADPLGALGAALAPTRLAPGTAVELVTDAGGTVRHVRPVAGGQSNLGAVAALRKSHHEVSARAAAASDQASSIDQELEVMKLASLDREAKITRLTNKLTDVTDEVGGLRKELARMAKELTQLRERLR